MTEADNLFIERRGGKYAWAVLTAIMQKLQRSWFAGDARRNNGLAL
jgi:hypothetical protein